MILTSNCKSSKSFAVLGPVHTSNIVEATFDFVEATFDFVATNGNNVKAAFDIVERIVQLVAFDNIAWALLLVWTGFNWNRVLPGPNGYKIPNAFLLVCLLVRRFKLSKL